MIAAVEKHDAAALQHILGPGAEKVVSSGDDVADRAAREAFVARYREAHEFVAGGPRDVVLQVGQDRWPLPIPLVQEAGRWRFDSEAGAEELVARRIGANELNTIDVLRGYVDGPAASGGERDYIEDGVQRGGFALIAYPAVYGTSGVMTFMVNQDGVIWQRDLGADTKSAATGIQAFNPDEHWTPLAPESNAELARR